MFQFEFLGVAVAFTLQFIPNTLEANLKITFPYVEIEIRWGVPVRGGYRARRGAEHIV